MVAPIRPDTVKSFTTVDGNGFQTKYWEKKKTWQKQPYNLPLTYHLATAQVVYSPGGPNYPDPLPPFNALSLATASTRHYNGSILSLAYNKAYENLKGNVYTSAQLGVDFVEYRQALGMIASTATTLVKVARSIRKLDFVGASRALRMKFIPKGVSARKSFANNWLEYHFGWEPLVRDIYDSLEVCNNPLNAFTRTRGSGGESWNSSFSQHNINYDINESWLSRYSCFEGLTVDAIHNSTTHALDQFGVLNPVEIAWELVPFSFVVDWFVNVGQVLSSYSDYAGMSLRNTWSSGIWRIRGAGALTPYSGSGYPGRRNYTFTAVRFDRATSLTSPVFALKQLRLPSKIRSLTAVSLLTQALS